KAAGVQNCYFPLFIPLSYFAKEAEHVDGFAKEMAVVTHHRLIQDGKALQAGTSHYLGTGFAEAANIRYQDKEGGQQLCHTTSWGVSTRLIGGVIMTHGDDDGLRVPPRIAPHQIVILPMLREDDGDEALLAYCEELRASLAKQWALDEPIRVLLDKRAGKATAKRWGWVKKGVPLILEIGGRDAAGGQVSAVRRDRLYREDGKVNFVGQSREEFLAAAAGELEDIQRSLHTEATERRDAQIHRGVTDFAGLEAFFSADQRYPGWVEVLWSRPTGAALDAVVTKLKALKLTIRNTPMNGEPVSGTGLFTGEPAVERIYVARAY
ncbi:MAG: His/Gly/Thr/Pro-type tRNA ligase C-terminal domain-containing protein, partial [Novosphingobium sp.]